MNKLIAKYSPQNCHDASVHNFDLLKALCGLEGDNFTTYLSKLSLVSLASLTWCELGANQFNQ